MSVNSGENVNKNEFAVMKMKSFKDFQVKRLELHSFIKLKTFDSAGQLFPSHANLHVEHSSGN